MPLEIPPTLGLTTVGAETLVAVAVELGVQANGGFDDRDGVGGGGVGQFRYGLLISD